MENDRHPGMNNGCYGVRSRRQDRAGLHHQACGIFPTIPESGKREQLPTIDLQAVRLFGFRGLLLIFSGRRRN